MIADESRQAIGARLTAAFNAMGFESERGRALKIGEAFGVSRETARKWEDGLAVPEMWRLAEISKRSGYSVQYLLTGEEEASRVSEQPGVYGSGIEPGPSLHGKLPLISWVQAGSWSNVADPYQPGVAEKWIPVTRKYSKKAYCLRVRGDSMQSPEGDSFPDGSIICVEPELAAEHKRYVIVRLDDSEEATFKQLIMEGSQQYLKPLNNRYPILRIDRPATFCGVVRQMVMDFG